MKRINGNLRFLEEVAFPSPFMHHQISGGLPKHSVITSVDDSSDGIAQEQIEENYTNDAHAYINKIFSNVSKTSLKSSFIVKEIGNRLLQLSNVREKYKQLKDPLSNILKQYNLFKQDIVKGSQSYIEITAKEQEIQALISKRDELRIGHVNDNTKANFKKDINNINYEIKKYADIYRRELDSFFQAISSQGMKDASFTLAKGKVYKKFDKDIGKINKYDYSYGTHKKNNNQDITKETTQQNITLTVCTAFAFKHEITNTGSYSTIGEHLHNLFANNATNPRQLKLFFKQALRGKIDNDIVINKHNMSMLIDQLKTLVQLFELEVQRNPGALLTIPMFFDLADKGYEGYNMKNIAEKMPMAMESAVAGSTYLDFRLEGILTALSKYDYRADGIKSKGIELAGRDDNILKDWFGEKDFTFTKYQLSELLNKIYFFIEEWYGLELSYLRPCIYESIIDCFNDLSESELETLSINELATLVEITQDNELVKQIDNLLSCKIGISDILTQYDDHGAGIFDLFNEYSIALSLIQDSGAEFEELCKLYNSQDDMLLRMLDIYAASKKQLGLYDTSLFEEVVKYSIKYKMLSDEDICEIVVNNELCEGYGDLALNGSDQSLHTGYSDTEIQHSGDDGDIYSDSFDL